MTQYSTSDIFQAISEGKPVPKEAFLSAEEMQRYRYQIWNAIYATGKSLNSVAKEANVSVSHLSDFLQGTKQFDRDHLLRVLITLSFDLPTINSMLDRFHVNRLYPKDQRDYFIICGIMEGKNLNEIDEILERENLPSLTYNTQKDLAKNGKSSTQIKK